jgi:mRNA interferase MazF
MNEGDVIISRMPQANGQTKPRPAILLRQMPPFGDWLTCGVSSKLQW